MAPTRFEASNFLEALLRAALILGDLRRATPVREITISSMQKWDSGHRVQTRCRITMEYDPVHRCLPGERAANPMEGERVLIVYPEWARSA